DPHGFLSTSNPPTNPLTLVRGTTINVDIGLMRAGDVDNNDTVNAVDFIILKSTFGRAEGQPGYDTRADFNGDRAVSTADFILLKLNFAMSGAPPIGPQP